MFSLDFSILMYDSITGLIVVWKMEMVNWVCVHFSPMHEGMNPFSLPAMGK